MKKAIFFVFVLVMILGTKVFGQTADSITVVQRMGPVFYQNGQVLKPRHLLEITRVNPEAHQEMRAAKSNYDASQVLGFIGGALIGWQLGTALGGGEANWVMAGVGAGIVGISIPFSAAYNKRARNAVSIYNKGRKPVVAETH